MFMFDNYFSEKKRVDLVLRECYGIGKTHSFRIFVKFGFSIKTKMQDLPYYIFRHMEAAIPYLVHTIFKLQVELVARHHLGIRLRLLRNNSKRYKSLRHYFKLPVRGQRTRNNARTQKRKRPNWKRMPIAGKKK